LKKIIFTSFIVIFLSCHSSSKPEERPKTKEYLNIFGKWKVVNASYVNFDHISYCEKLGVNSIFTFNKYGETKVYEDNKTSKNCNEIQQYWIKNDDLVFFEYDFFFNYKIIKLSKDSLILKSEHFPRFLENKISLQDYINGKRDSINERIKKEGITITLKKII
jgi:hypothetical protein